jgi:hypothetical protein
MARQLLRANDWNTMNKDLEKIWKTMVWCKKFAAPKFVCREHEKPEGKNSRCLGRDLNKEPPDYKSKALQLQPICL